MQLSSGSQPLTEVVELATEDCDSVVSAEKTENVEGDTDDDADVGYGYSRGDEDPVMG